MTETLEERGLEIVGEQNASLHQVIMDKAEPRLTTTQAGVGFLPDRIVQKLNALAQVPSNWDSYGGEAVALEKVASARGLLECLFSNYELPDPQLSPTRSGGVLIEWSSGPHELEIELVLRDAFSFVYSNTRSGFEYDGVAFSDEPLDDRFLKYLNYMC